MVLITTAITSPIEIFLARAIERYALSSSFSIEDKKDDWDQTWQYTPNYAIRELEGALECIAADGRNSLCVEHLGYQGDVSIGSPSAQYHQIRYKVGAQSSEEARNTRDYAIAVTEHGLKIGELRMPGFSWQNGFSEFSTPPAQYSKNYKVWICAGTIAILLRKN
jgi:hypothetical protein